MTSRKPLTLPRANTSAEIPCQSYHNNNNLQVQQQQQNNHTSDNNQKQQYQHQPDRKLTYLSNNHQKYGAPRRWENNESSSIEDGYWQVQTRQQNTNRFNLSRRNTESVKEDTTLAEEEENEVADLNSTQRLRSGFFRAIKRQYPKVQERSDAEQSIIATSPNQSCSSARNEPGLEEISSKQPSAVPMKFPIKNNQLNTDEESLSFISMKRSARRKLNQLRKCDPSQVDIQTGLQWIRLELNEMREQDKSIFLQLAKVYSNLKDLKSELNHKNNDEDFEYSCEDFYQLPSWWSSHGKIDEFKTLDLVQASPGSIFSSPPSIKTATNFSASDGAQFVRTLSVQNHRRRRGRSPLPVPLPSTPLVFNF